MISREICQRVLHKAVSTGADYAEIFAENTVNHNISMIAGKVESVKGYLNFFIDRATYAEKVITACCTSRSITPSAEIFVPSR